MNLRVLTEKDHNVFAKFFADLRHSHHEALPHIFKEKPYIPTAEVFSKMLSDPNCVLFGAEKEGKLLGFCQLNFKEHPDIPEYPIRPAKRAHIEELYVAPEFRNQGVATALIGEAKRQARNRHAAKLTLMVWDFNKNAIALYRKLGMTTTFCQMEEML